MLVYRWHVRKLKATIDKEYDKGIEPLQQSGCLPPPAKVLIGRWVNNQQCVGIGWERLGNKQSNLQSGTEKWDWKFRWKANKDKVRDWALLLLLISCHVICRPAYICSWYTITVLVLYCLKAHKAENLQL